MNNNNNNEIPDSILESQETGVDVFDEGDLAFAAENRFLTQALEAHKSKMKPETHPDFDGKNCLDCEDEIPTERLKMFKIRCVPCQELLDKKSNKKY